MSDESRTDGASTPGTTTDPYIVMASGADAPEPKPDQEADTPDEKPEPIVLTPGAQRANVKPQPITLTPNAIVIEVRPQGIQGCRHSNTKDERALLEQADAAKQAGLPYKHFYVKLGANKAEEIATGTDGSRPPQAGPVQDHKDGGPPELSKRAPLAKIKGSAGDPDRTASRKGQRPTKKRARRPRALTAKQAEVIEAVANCHGNMSEAARKLHLSRTTVVEQYDSAMKKVPEIVRMSSPTRRKTQRLPTDSRGQSLLHSGG